MILNPGDSNNYGPHCRNCHTGASSCVQCHGAVGAVAKGGYTTTTTVAVNGRSVFWPNSFQANSAIANINGQCVDGGFSFPHRTLGANMLKDQLWGVDFDGTPIAAGATRGTAGTSANLANLIAAGFTSPTGSLGANPLQQGSKSPYGTLIGATTENLDSVCIDCHGNATYYDKTGTYGTDPFGTGATGWELLLKGLP
jgi:hypothetical protein